jgi:hypothetical protein
MNDVKTIIHLHTDYSYDSDIAVDVLADFIEREGVGCVAVTDHDTILGARRLAAITDAHVIVGEEVSTRDGHLIGLFLSEHVRPGMSAMDTARAIHNQGGVVLVPHPFIRALSCGLGKVAWRIAEHIDAVEVCNAQNLSRRADRLAAAFAAEFGLPAYVGADSHDRTSIAPCYQMMRDSADAAGFIDAMREAELFPGRHAMRYFAAAAHRVARYCLGLSLPGEFGANLPPQADRAGVERNSDARAAMGRASARPRGAKVTRRRPRQTMT